MPTEEVLPVCGLRVRRAKVVATDATGFSGHKRRRRETPYATRARENWVKVHAAIEVDSFFVLSYEPTKSNVHESRAFSSVWDRIPGNVAPVRSLATARQASPL
jgi:hypothetical protein